MVVGICKFCGQERELIKSHIIPKSFYRLKERGRFAAITPSDRRVDIVYHQNGFKEYLMCSNCDGSLGNLDAYAERILFQEICNHPFRTVDNIKTYLLQKSEFDYENLRKFFISLVWRASISSEFNTFSLGKYEDVALKILKGELSDNADLFVPIVMRKQTQTPIDNISTCFRGRVLGKYACLIKFPDYEIKVITNTKDNNSPEIMRIYKSCLTPEEFLVMETDCATDYDVRLLEAIIRSHRPNNHIIS